jgi:hypothetical protein
MPLPLLLAIVAAALIAVALRRDLSALVALVILANLPFFTDTVWDTRDTTATFEAFYALYGELYHSDRLLLWLPYGTFGQIADYVTGFACSGVDFFVLLLGRLLRVKDAWFLFCLARLGEQLVFLQGTFLLSRVLFTRRSTVFMVCLVSSGGLAWYWHSFFSLRMIYVFPLALLFLVWFFEKRRPEFLWLSGLCCVFAGQGASYAMCIWLFVLLIVSGVLLATHRDAWRALLSRSWRNLALLGLLLALAGSFVYVSVASVKGVVFLKSARDPGSGEVPLDDYLGHGGNPRLNRIGRDLLAGDNDINEFDNNFYVGLLPLFFLAWGLARERSARFWAIASAAIALLWLSLGGAFAALTYYLPFMAYYRWLAWVLPLVRVLIVLAGGFGFERFWHDAGRLRLSAGIVLLMLFTADAVGVSYPAFYPVLGLYAAATATAVLFGQWALQGTARTQPGRADGWIRLALVGALGIDILLYQQAVHAKLPRLSLSVAEVAEMFSVSRMEYQERRTNAPSTPRAVRALRHAPVSYPHASHNFLRWDGCALGGPPDHLLMVPAGIHRLFQLRDSDDLALRAIVGCETPKLRLVSRAVYAADDRQAAEYLEAGVNLESVAVLQLPSGMAAQPPGPAPDPSSGAVQVAAFGANHIELVADLAGRNGAGAWLVYADGYHRGWHATVNGARAPIAKAYLAFKAVWLPAGRSAVRLWFYDGLASTLTYGLALWSIAVDLLLLAWFARLLREGMPAR